MNRKISRTGLLVALGALLVAGTQVACSNPEVEAAGDDRDAKYMWLLDAGGVKYVDRAATLDAGYATCEFIEETPHPRTALTVVSIAEEAGFNEDGAITLVASAITALCPQVRFVLDMELSDPVEPRVTS